MKVKIQFKDPDGVSDSIDEAVKNSVGSLRPDFDAEEMEQVIENRTLKVRERLSPWIKYGEYLLVEFDTDAGTATVLPSKPL